MSHDTAPNLSTLVMGAKDKLTGGVAGFSSSESREVYVDSITPQTIVGEAQKRIGWKEKELQSVQVEKPSSELEWEISQLKDVVNIANAVRLNGPTTLIGQSRRELAAEVLTKEVMGHSRYYNGMYGSLTQEEQSFNQQYDSILLYTSAALGVKESRQTIEEMNQEK